MEKKSKKSIVIGLTSLFLVMLILVGLTYAYYRVKIIGNDSPDPSISVQAKNMEITYEDGAAVLSTGIVDPGFTASKTFYVKNTGTDTVKYSVVLENLTNEFVRNQDWQVTLTKNGTPVISASDNVYLLTGSRQILLGSAETPTTDTYVLKIKYKNLPEEDQSIDMGKSLSFKVNIVEEQYTWNNAPSGSLLYALKANKPTGSEETSPANQGSTANEARILEVEDDYGISYVYRGNVLNNYVTYSNMCWRIVRIQGDGTIKLALADENYPCTANVVPTETTVGPLGDPAPVYKGYTTENTASAFMGRNTVVSAFENHAQQYSDSWGQSVIYKNGQIPTWLKEWATKKIEAEDGSVIREQNLDITKLAETEWCNDTSVGIKYRYWYDDDYNIVYDEKLGTKGGDKIYFGPIVRLHESSMPTLKCDMVGINNTRTNKSIDYIGMLTVDEIRFAGVLAGDNGVSHPNCEHSKINTNTGYVSYIDTNASDNPYYTISPYETFEIDGSGPYPAIYANYYKHFGGDNYNAIRPVVVLKSNVLLDATISGQNGTQSNPYVIS